ncbi:MAG: DHA2 family efflux MFS transporter permease subunit, partial [Thermoleophilia bacterium]|nr:DHA2 family efflux MFS transporter permease subunit [Thermoleophilia bacterium]
LGFSDDNRQWVITAYTLAFGSLLLFGGRLADVFGRKHLLLAGLIGFSVASAVGGSASNFEVLLSARAAQGLFGALLAPAALSTLTTTFTDPNERGKAFGIYGAIAGAGAALGLILGGALTQYLSWRWCLYVNLALAIPAVIAAVVLLTNQRPEGKARLDLLGTVTVSIGLLGIVYGCSQAATKGWTSTTTLGCLIGGLVLLAIFVLIELRVENPLLPMRVVLDRARGGAYLGLGLACVGMFGVFLFLTYYLQTILMYSPIKTGFAFLPMVGGIMVMATLSTAVLLPRVGARMPVVAGMIFSAVGMGLLTQIGVDTGYVSHVLPGLVVLGLGLGMLFATCFEVGTSGVQAHDAGIASAMANTTQQVGGSIGTALLSTIAASAVASFMADGLGDQMAAAVHSYSVAFWVSAGIFAASAVICGLLMPGGAYERDMTSAPIGD